jgi:hypothetical protein
MVKRFLQLLIVAVTVQFTYGLASVYCGHETGKASLHFGHHTHQHQIAGSSDDNVDNSPSPNKIGGDPDCATCAHSLASACPSSLSSVTVLICSHTINPHRVGQPAPYLGSPERPQWAVAA